MRHSWQAIIAATVITLLNAAKPAAVDDTAYLLFARHLAQHPLDPYGFELFWYREPEPAMHILLPPVVPYWLSLGIALFGEQLVLLKLWLFPFSLAFALAVRFLLRRFARGMENAGTLLMVVSPFVLPLFGAMLDMPAVALGLAAVALFIQACDRGRWRWVVLAGLLAALAAQTKYTMIAVPVVFAWYGLLHRRLAMTAVATLAAVAAFAAWEYWLFRQYGVSHFLHHVRDQGTNAGLREKLDLFQPMLGYLGGLGLAWGLLAARALGLGKRLIFAVGVVSIAGILAVVALPYADSILLMNRDTGSVRLDLAGLVFGSLGTGVLLTAIAAAGTLVVRRNLRPRMSADAWFVAGWFAIEFVAYFAFTPFPAGRRVIGLCVAIGLVACRLASRRLRGRSVRGITALGVALGLGLFALDAWDAQAEKALVEQSAKAIGNPDPHRVWTQGHWGWQYYADRQGWELIEPGRSELRTGDWLVLPVIPDEIGFYRPYHGGATFALDSDAAAPVAEFVLDDPVAGQTIPNLYGGTVPIVGRDHPRLRVVVYRVTRDWVPQRR